jgi:hypothetical protein
MLERISFKSAGLVRKPQTSEDAKMTFNQAKAQAVQFGANLPKFPVTAPGAAAWIDRIEWLPRAAELGRLENWIKECDRYANSIRVLARECDC